MWLLAVDARLEVGPARQTYAVDAIEQRRDRVGRSSGTITGTPPARSIASG